MDGDGMVNYEGVHFLAALDAESGASDVENGSWNSSISDEESQEPPLKKFCSPDAEWVEGEVNTINPFPFTGDSGMRFTLEDPEPIDMFNFVCKSDFLDQILHATNEYGKELVFLEEPSGTKFWKLLTRTELCQFLGLVFHTGTIRMSNLSDYWSSNKLFDVRIFRSMQKERFMRILSALRFGDVAVDDNYKVASLEPIELHFNSAMISVCYPGRELIVDDCMIIFNGSLMLKDHVNPLFGKPELYLHSLSEPNGFVHKIVIADFHSSSPDLIRSLMKDKVSRGHSLYLDPNYCSVATVREMTRLRTYCTGILHPQSKSLPPEILDAKIKTGESILRFSEPGICLMKWRAKGDILAISSEYRSAEDNEVHDSQHKPLMVKEYRKLTKEVDRREFAMSYQLFDGKNLGWYRSILIQILQLMLKNAYLLYTNNVKKTSFHDFRLSCIESLLTKERGAELIPSHLPLVDDNVLHVPRKFPKREGQRALRKRCRVCLKDGKRTDSYYHCPRCPNQPALCLERCFAEYHSAIQSKIKTDQNSDGDGEKEEVDPLKLDDNVKEECAD